MKDGKSEAYYVVNPKTKRVVSGPYGSEAEALKKSGGKLPAGREIFAVPDNMVVITCGKGAVVCPGAGGAGVSARAHLVLPLQVRPARTSRR